MKISTVIGSIYLISRIIPIPVEIPFTAARAW